MTTNFLFKVSFFFIFFISLFGISFFLPHEALAQSCSGSVTCESNCGTYSVPSGCSSSCSPTDPYCKECTGYERQCDTAQESCGFAHVWGGSCAADCSSVGGNYSSGSCSSSGGSNPTPTPTTCTIATSWTNWGACSVACGGGVRTRYNTCSGQTQSEACNTHVCPVLCTDNPNAYWTSWSCNTTCGTGTETRNNTCTGASESRGCTRTNTCSCNWGNWSNCSTSCGNGTQYRTDDCGNSQTQSCSSNIGCTECTPTWSSWSNCSATCNGTQTRRNICDGVEVGSESRVCNVCPVYSVTSTVAPPNCSNLRVEQVGSSITVYAEPTGSERTYLLPDYSFESGTMGMWPYQNDLEFASAFDYTTNPAFPQSEGTWFMALRRNPLDFDDPFLTTEWFDGGIGDLSGKTVQLSFLARGETISYPVYAIGVQTRAVNDDWTNNTSTYAYMDTITVTPQVWKEYTLTATFPEPAAGYSTSEMRIVLRAGQNSYPMFYDSIKLKAIGVVNGVRFWYTPYQGASGNYCGATWTEIPGANYAGAPYFSEDTWYASFSSTALTPDEPYYIVANVADNNGLSCTGNPSGICGTGFTGQCTGCRTVFTACTSTCNACSTAGDSDGCGGTCSAGASNGIPSGFATVITPDSGANIDPALFTYTYPIVLEYQDGSGKADFVEYLIIGESDPLLNQAIGSTPTQLQALATANSDSITYKRLTYTGSLTYNDTATAKAAQGQRLRILTRAVNTTCGTEQYTAWDNHFFNLTGEVVGDLLNDPAGNCSGTSTATLPSGSVYMIRNGSVVGFPVVTSLTNATSYQSNLIPFTPDINWTTQWGMITGTLVINNTDLTNAYICSECGSVGGYIIDNTCTADYTQCTCTISYQPDGLTTHSISSFYSPYDFYIQDYNLSNDPWWQAWGGLVYSYGNIRSLSPIPPSIPESCRADQQCDPHLIQTSSGPNSSGADPTKAQSAGIAIVNGSSTITAGNDVGGFFANRNNNERVTGGHNQSGVTRENYDYFAKTTDVDVPDICSGTCSTTNINTLSQLTAQTTASGDSVYSVPGHLNLTVNITSGGKWNIAGGTKHVVYVPGNLTIDVQNVSTNADQQELINVPTDSFLGFIVGGNITITENVGYSGNANLDALQTPNIEGVFIANGTLTVKSYGITNPADRKFVGAGTFVGWTNVDLQRDFADGHSRKELHSTTPTETFIHRPDFLINVPTVLQRAQLTWEEVN